MSGIGNAARMYRFWLRNGAKRTVNCGFTVASTGLGWQSAVTVRTEVSCGQPVSCET